MLYTQFARSGDDIVRHYTGIQHCMSWSQTLIVLLLQPLHHSCLKNHHRSPKLRIQQDCNRPPHHPIDKPAHQGVENQAHISRIRSLIDSAFASGTPLGPNIPWRPVDYFEHMKLPSEDVLKCSVRGDSSVDRQCLQDVMSSWNARCVVSLVRSHDLLTLTQVHPADSAAFKDAAALAARFKRRNASGSVCCSRGRS